MNKKIIALLLILFIFALSGCSLIDNSDGSSGGENGTLEITDDFMVGIFLYTEKYDSVEGDYIVSPTKNFEDKNAISLYHATRRINGQAYGELMGGNYFSEIFFGIDGAGTKVNKENPYGKLEIKASLRFTYELLENILFIGEVYQKNDNSGYYGQHNNSGHYLSSFGQLSLSSEQNLKASQKNALGMTNEIKYDCKWTLDVIFIDYLISANIVEFDKNSNIINSQNIDLTSEEIIEHKALSNCEYIIIEEEYEIKHQNTFSPNSIGTKYTKRYLLNKSNIDQFHYLYTPEGNGFVNTSMLKLKY